MFRRALLTCAFLAAAPVLPAFAQGCDTTFALANRSGRQVNEIYFSSSRNDNWGNDRLGQNVLPNGTSRQFRPSPGGNYDFRIVFDNGQAVERRGVDLCAVSTVTVTARGISAE